MTTSTTTLREVFVRKGLLLAIVVSLAVSASAAASPRTGSPAKNHDHDRDDVYYAPADGFVVRFPGKPEVERGDTGARYIVDVGPVTYLVVSDKHPPIANPVRLFSLFEQRLATVSRREVIAFAVKSAGLGPYPGMRLDGTANGKDIVSEMYVVDGTFFSIVVTAPAGHMPITSAEAFLDSFALYVRGPEWPWGNGTNGQ